MWKHKLSSLFRSIKLFDVMSPLTTQFLLAVALTIVRVTQGYACDDGRDGVDIQMTARPKRVGPAPVAPVVINGRRIEAVDASRKRGLGQNGGYLEAFDQASGKSLWLLQVYQIDYAKNMEEDVQDRFIAKIESTADGANLLVTDENGNRFEVDLATRAVHIAPADQRQPGLR